MNFFIHIWVFIVTLFVAPTLPPVPTPIVIEATSSVGVISDEVASIVSTSEVDTPVTHTVVKEVTVPVDTPQVTIPATTSTPPIIINIAPVVPTQPAPQVQPVNNSIRMPQATEAAPLISDVSIVLACRGKLGESLDKYNVTVTLSEAGNVKYTTNTLYYTSTEAQTTHTFEVNQPVNVHDYRVDASTDTTESSVTGKIPPYGDEDFCN